MSRAVGVATPGGPARAHVHDAVGARTRGTVVLGHGAGGGIEARDLAELARSLPPAGYRVVLVEQPWRVAGRRVATAPPRLDEAWCAVLAALRAREELVGPRLVVGGRSAGARVACRTAVETGAEAALLLAFPLHPPGRPGSDRAGEALAAGVPVAVVQGDRDPFGSADEVRRAVPSARVVAVPWADHAMKVPRSAPLTQAEALGVVGSGACAALAEWESVHRG